MSLADHWFKANERLEEIQRDIDGVVESLAKSYGFVCCGMATEDRLTLIVTLRRVPQDMPTYEKLRETIGEATGFDYVELIAR